MLEKLRLARYMRRVSPKADFEALAYGPSSPRNLFECEIRQLLEVVDKELGKSFTFGLEIDHVDAFAEKAALIFTLSTIGSPLHYTRNHTYEYVRRELGERMFRVLSAQTHKYFERLSAAGKVPSMYNCHIDSVCNEVVRAIYDGKISYAK